VDKPKAAPQDLTLLDEFEQNVETVIGILEDSVRKIDQWIKYVPKSSETGLQSIPQRTNYDVITILESFYLFADSLPEILRFLSTHVPPYESKVKKEYSNINEKILEIVGKCEQNPLNPPPIPVIPYGEMTELRRYIEELVGDLRYCTKEAREKSAAGTQPASGKAGETKPETEQENWHKKGQVKMALHEIANKVDKLIIDPTVRARFTKHIDQFCIMVEDYGQALQPYAEKLERTKKQLMKIKQPPNTRIRLVDKCPPPKGWIKTFYTDNYCVNVPMSVIYRPSEPVNPLPWFGIFGNPGIQREPTENEKLMCEYMLLAVIHDRELRQPTDRPLFSNKYNDKWFERDKFREAVWTYYHYSYNKPSLLCYPATDQEKLSQLNRALERVKADLLVKVDLAQKPAETGQDIKTVEEDEMITITEAAKLLGVDKGVASRWATDGVIKDNGETKRKRRVSKVSVLLLKDKRESEDRLKNAADVLQDMERKIPNRH
jgi:hypothetical protein